MVGDYHKRTEKVDSKNRGRRPGTMVCLANLEHQNPKIFPSVLTSLDIIFFMKIRISIPHFLSRHETHRVSKNGR